MEQRSTATLAHTFRLLGERGLEIGDKASLVQRNAIFGKQDGSAPRREHDGAFTRDVFDDLTFALPETVLAFAREDVGDVDPGPRLDFRVAVSKGSPKQARQVFAHGCLSRAHRTDQKYVDEAG